MILRDVLLLLGFFLICTILYLLLSLIPPRNRSRAGYCAVCRGLVLAVLLTAGAWYFAFCGPLSRNWGLGGTYLWMAVCPALYLVSGTAMTIYNILRKEKKHDCVYA